MSTRPIRFSPIRTAAHRSIEDAGRAPVLGWIDDRRVPLKAGANVRETFDLIRKTLMERHDGTSTRPA